jgi:N-acetyl-gamma-glutamyl-phosphate reductase
MSFTVAVAGASGYAGGEILRLLLAHPEAEIGTLTAGSSAGQPLSNFHPHLAQLADRVLQDTTPEALAGADVVVLALPHGASGPVAAQLAPGQVVLDCGADHRLEDGQDWRDYYGGDHPGTWTYGMPELLLGWNAAEPAAAPKQRTQLPGARHIAVPGCNVTAVTLALQPGIAAGLISPEDLVCVLACGYSGAGKGYKPHLMAAEALGAASPYSVGGTHRHIPEIVQNLRHALGSSSLPTQADPLRVTLSFTPSLVPMARGILATCTARLAPGVLQAAGGDPARVQTTLRAAWEAAYSGEPVVTLLPEGRWPNTAAVLGANAAQLQLAYDAKAGRVVVVAAIDNLVKGTAGGAIQSLNLALGLPEGTGLQVNGVAP